MPTLYGLARVGRDTELRYSPQGEAVCNVSLAFNYGKKGDDGKRPTTWVDCAVWGKRAEALSPYLTKGKAVAVSIEDVHIETFKTRDGTPGAKIVGRLLQIELAGGGEQGSDKPAPAAAPAPRAAPTAAAKPATAFDDMDSDIPF